MAAAVKTSALVEYGYDFKVRPSNQLEIEMYGFVMPGQEPEQKANHFKNIVGTIYPWAQWSDWNELCLWAWCNYQEIGMTGCAAAGKTWTFSLLACMEFFCAPAKTGVVMSSATVPSLRTRLWPRVKDFYRRFTVSNGKVMQEICWPYHLVDSKTQIQWQKGDDEHSIRAVAVDSGPAEQAIGKFIGSHPGRVMMVVDEAAQTKPAVFDARSNLSVGTTFFRFVAIANAVSQFDAHGKFCEPKRGWSTVSVNDESWETATGICVHFDGLKSPNVQAGYEKYAKIFSISDIDRIRMQSGGRENTLAWWSQVRGFWPPSNISNTVLDAATIIAGKAREKATWETTKRPVAALDPAFTSGGDRCMFGLGFVGKMTDGRFGLEVVELIEIHLDASGSVPINYQIAERVIAECAKHKISPEDFGMDATSASGLADILAQRWSGSYRRIQFGGSATERAVGHGDARKSKEVYANRVTELWFSMQKIVVAQCLRGLDDETAQELCVRQYEMRGEKHVVESKRDMKERTNGTSPDRADCLAILVDIFRDLHGEDGSAALPQVAVRDDWHFLQKQFDRIHHKTYKAA